MNRRRFLQTSAAISTVTLFGGLSHAAKAGSAYTRPYKELGVQLYTVRDLFQQDYRMTIERIAAIGYKDLEFPGSGVYDHSPSDVRSLMNDLGLISRSVHVGIDVLRNGFDGALESAAFFGQKHLVLPYLGDNERVTLDQYKAHADLLNRCGEQAKAAGCTMAYHNHDFEFVPLDGALPYDVLLAETQPDLVKMQLDLYWIVKAGYDPLDYFNKAPGRFTSCHVKDYAADGSMAAVGDGTIDFKAIFTHAEKAGLERYYVEHDNPASPLESIERSFAHLMAPQE